MRAEFFGTVTRDDLLGMFREIEAIERTVAVTPDRIAVVAGDVAWAVTGGDFRDLTNRRRAARLANAVKTAIVAKEAAHVGMARMFQQLNDHPQVTIRIFESEDAALRWLAD